MMMSESNTPSEPAKLQAEHMLTRHGLYAGHQGLRGLLDAAEFWERQPYGTRLYYGPGNADYFHRSVLSCAIKALDEMAGLVDDLAAALSERDALAARVEKGEADARRWRFVRGKVSRILNERTLKMDGLRVEVYYDEPQAFLIVPTDNGALFDEAIDAGMSREEKS